MKWSRQLTDEELKILWDTIASKLDFVDPRYPQSFAGLGKMARIMRFATKELGLTVGPLSS
jgi:hypothetical protein